MSRVKEELEDIRIAAENDLETFIRLVAPYQFIPSFHQDIIRWWTREDAKDHQLLLIPRDHGKSRLVAFYAAWMITKDPSIRILYISATSNLAEKQLGFIKSILTSSVYRRYWPDMVKKQEKKRARWTNTEICVDHPKREEQGVRDPTIFTAGLTTSITGLHCDVAILDDVVVSENAFTNDGREKVKRQYSLLSSIEGATSREIVVGTRYEPHDLYQDMLDMKEQVFDETGELIREDPVYELYEKVLEDRGDGTGEYLWPRDKTSEGKWFGFDQNIRAQKYAKYLDKRQFWAQYYNNPNPKGEMAIDSTRFQYYENRWIKQRGGAWFYGNNKLNVYAAIDFAFSLKNRADFTAIVVVGIDAQRRVYVLDIVRFKTDKISDYFKYVQAAYLKWGFRKLRAEVTSAQSMVVTELKDNYIRPNGLALAIDEFKPHRTQGTKEERIAAVLEPRYEDMLMFHYRGGNCQLLEEELLSENPAHDDVKDALASAVSIAVPPSEIRSSEKKGTVVFNKRFGGVA